MVALHYALVSFDTASFSDDFSAKLTLTADRMMGYQIIRPSVDQLAKNGSDPIALYALSGSQLLDLNTLIAEESPDDSLSGSFSSYVAGSKAKQSSSDSFSLITESLGGGVLTDQHYSSLVRSQLDHQTQLGVFLSLATPEQKELYRRTITGPAVSATTDGVNEVITSGVGAPITLDPTSWQQDSITTLNLGRQVETTVENDLLSQASEQESAAHRDVIAYGLLALSAAAFAIASAVVLSRAITRPLRRLAIAAHEVADEQLPSLVEALRNPSEDGSVAMPHMTPVERTSKDEVGDLAEAFASIQETAVSVAIRAVEPPPQGHRRALREPRSPQPEPPRSSDRLPRPARSRRDRSRCAREPVQARPPRDPHAAQRRVAARPRGHRGSSPLGQARRAR